VTVVHFVCHLVTGNFDFFTIHDYDEITVVNVRCEFWLMFATKAMSDLGSETAKDLVLCVNYKPLAGDIFRLRAESFHLYYS
jgi:hypothetical protein